ncbi:hypothetical protein RCL1_006336 [Eukaryota sp. TZLM3-RCL]
MVMSSSPISQSSTPSVQQIVDSVHRLLSTSLSPLIKQSLSILEDAFQRYPDNLIISFNGGKDNTVVFYLCVYFLTKLSNNFASQSQTITSSSVFIDSAPDTPSNYFLGIPIVFFDVHPCFTDVISFMDSLAKSINFSIHRLTGSFVDCLQTLIKFNRHAVITGIRSTDPHSKSLSPIAPSSPGWPQVVRISPILNWSYDAVWKFLLATELPYCCLYSLGYTSLGAPDDTIPNPILRQDDGSFLHANCLSDEEHERSGRS